MNYSVVFYSDSGEIIRMLQKASLENAIAFASYLFVNTNHSYSVLDQNGSKVVSYFKIS